MASVVKSLTGEFRARLRVARQGITREPLTYLGCLGFRVFRPGTLRHTLQITSAGGVGTTFLYEFAENAKLNIYLPYDGGPYYFDRGIWKHQRRPFGRTAFDGRALRPGYRAIYLVGNPYNSIMSLFRRGFSASAPARLEAPLALVDKLDSDWTLEDYLENGEDLLLLEDHILNWTQRPVDKDYPILVLKYETLSDNIDVLLDFIGAPREKAALFPEFRPRASSYKSLPPEMMAKMERLYGNVAAYVDNLPEWFIR